MLAKLRDDAFSDEDWLYEVKWDGYRAVAEVNGNDIKLYSRNGISFHNDYPTVYGELQKFEHPVIVDGEIVALDKDGVAQFQLLQQYGKDNSTRLCYYVFDLLNVDGTSVKQLPLIERKELLKKVLPKSDIIRYCDHIETEGEHFFEALHEQGVEGMIAKKKDSSYIEGKRGNTWYKIKHALTDEAVIAGYTAPRGGRKYFGALVLGIYNKNKLQYIGHTGTGFNAATLKELHGKMQPLVQDKNPFGEKIPVNAPVTWLKPELVANIKYTEITMDGIRRHPVFLGLRKDKEPEEVVGEPYTKRNTMDKTKTVGGHKVELTNTNKVYWPGEGITKGDVIAYYDSMYKYIMKYLRGRPQSLKRNPNGIKDEGFFHKDAGDNSPEWVDTFPVWSDSADKEVNYLVCNNKATLLYLANLGCIELNPWSSVTSKPDYPDYAVIDLDPSDNNSFDDVVDAALTVRDILKKAGAEAYCKTSGATGLHVYIPMGRKYDYDHVKSFAELIAHMTVAALPGITTVERSLKKRDNGKIYVDYLQNRKGQTLSAAYSLRPRKGAPVSTPLEWKEVKHGLNPLDFNIHNIKKRLEKKGDLFAPVLQKGIDMMKVLKKLEGN